MSDLDPLEYQTRIIDGRLIDWFYPGVFIGCHPSQSTRPTTLEICLFWAKVSSMQ